MWRSNSKILNEYIAWLLNSFHRQVSNCPFYRIVETRNSPKNKEEEFLIQVVGKITTFYATAKELVENEKFLKGFSPLDVKILTISAYKYKDNYKKYQLLAQKISQGSNQEMVVLRNRVDGEVFTKPVDYISCNMEVIDNLSSRDAHMLGYIYGSKSSYCDIQ